MSAKLMQEAFLLALFSVYPLFSSGAKLTSLLTNLLPFHLKTLAILLPMEEVQVNYTGYNSKNVLQNLLCVHFIKP
jgi:hypothetical protein